LEWGKVGTKEVDCVLEGGESRGMLKNNLRGEGTLFRGDRKEDAKK